MDTGIDKKNELKLFETLFLFCKAFINKEKEFPEYYKRLSVFQVPPLIDFFKEYIHYRYILYKEIRKAGDKSFFEALRATIISLQKTIYAEYSTIILEYIEANQQFLERKYIQWAKKEDFGKLIGNFFTSDFNNFFDIFLEYVSNFIDEEKKKTFFEDHIYYSDYYNTIPLVLKHVPDNEKIILFVTPMKKFAIYLINMLGITEENVPSTIHEFIFRYYCRYSIESDDVAGYDDLLISDTGKSYIDLENDFKNIEYLLMLNPLKKVEFVNFYGIPLRIEKMSNRNETWFKYSVEEK